MKSVKKVTIIGGGGRVAFTLVANFLRYPAAEIDNLDICLYDTDKKNLHMSKQTIGAVKKLTKRKLHVSTTTDLIEALADSDIILYGVNGDRGTTPPFNVSKYFGNIEILLNFLDDYYRYVRNSWLIIFSNPVDLLCMSAQKKFPALKIAGICTGSEEFKQNLCRFLKVSYEDIDLEYIGTNHHGFVQKLYVKEKDVLPELPKLLEKYKPEQFEGFRKGDEYDLYTTLDLFNASGELT